MIYKNRSDYCNILPVAVCVNKSIFEYVTITHVYKWT